MIPAKLAAIDGSREASRAWTPSFIAATEPLPAALTVKRYACGFFSFFSCPTGKRTRSAFAKGERNVLFSLRRKAPKDSLRLPPQTPIHLPGSAYPRLERCCSARGARTGHHSPCEKQVRLGNPRPQAQSCRSALAVRSACSAVDCVPLRYANTCREPTRRALGSHERSSRRLAASFRSFLVRTRKGHVSLLFKGEEMCFSH